MSAYTDWVNAQTVTNYRFDPGNYSTDANGSRYTPGLSAPITTKVAQIADTVTSALQGRSGGGGNVINVYGAPVDLSSARAVLGSGYNFINTTGWSLAQQQGIGAGSIVVGGVNSGGGVNVDLSTKGVTRLYGNDSGGTAAAIMSFASQGLYGGTGASSVPGVGSVPVVTAVNHPDVPTVVGSTGVLPSSAPSPVVSSLPISDTSTGGTSLGSSVLSGLTFDSVVAIGVSVMFLTAVLGLFRRGH